MLFKKSIQLFLVFLLSAVFCLAAKGDKVEVKEFFKKISEEILGKSLIRKDLLFEKREKLNPPRRNIFSPFEKRTSAAEPLPEDVEINLKGMTSKSRENSYEIMPDVRYIGYIESGLKIVALIFFDGEALAVGEGEMITEEIRVGKVSSEEIELTGPESRKWKYSLEGEEE